MAAFYYVVNLRAAMKLADPHFYRKEPWMYEHSHYMYMYTKVYLLFV